MAPAGWRRSPLRLPGWHCPVQSYRTTRRGPTIAGGASSQGTQERNPAYRRVSPCFAEGRAGVGLPADRVGVALSSGSGLAGSGSCSFEPPLQPIAASPAALAAAPVALSTQRRVTRLSPDGCHVILPPILVRRAATYRQGCTNWAARAPGCPSTRPFSALRTRQQRTGRPAASRRSQLPRPGRVLRSRQGRAAWPSPSPARRE